MRRESKSLEKATLTISVGFAKKVKLLLSIKNDVNASNVKIVDSTDLLQGLLFEKFFDIYN